MAKSGSLALVGNQPAAHFVSEAGENAAAVGAEEDVANPLAPPRRRAKDGSLHRLVRVPDADGLIERGRYQGGAVGTEGDLEPLLEESFEDSFHAHPRRLPRFARGDV